MPLWVYHPTATDAAVAAYTRAMIRDARDLLELPMPDTFLGRKTHEPFPEERQINLPYGAEDRLEHDDA